MQSTNKTDLSTSELIDRAYLIATGQYLTQPFTQKEFNTMWVNDLPKYTTEAYEDWPQDTLIHSIQSLAKTLLETFQELSA